jgi:plastocyanin
MPMHRSHRVLLRTGFGVAALVGTVLVSGCGSGTTSSAPASSTTSAAGGSTAAAAPAEAVTVQVKNMQFTPDTVTVKAGGTVTWNFADRFPHAVQGIGDSAMGIDSPIFNTGKWSHTFTVPGTYRYLCPLHPDMHGTVTVQ